MQTGLGVETTVILEEENTSRYNSKRYKLPDCDSGKDITTEVSSREHQNNAGINQEVVTGRMV